MSWSTPTGAPSRRRCTRTCWTLTSTRWATNSVSLGLVDGQNTLVESPETIRERIEWFQEQTPAEDYETVYATSNTELFYLPVNKFEAKLDALGAATAEVTA